MKTRRSSALALALTGALLLAACTSPAADDADADETAAPDRAASVEADGPCKADLGDVQTADGTVSISIGEVEWLGYNSNTPETYSTYNSVVNSRMFGSFFYYGTDGTICEDAEFGSIELVSEEPLVTRYTIADDAVWSDGEPVQYADYLLEWAAQAIPTAETAGTDDEEPLFNNVSGLRFGGHVPEGPQGEAGGKSMQYDYAVVYPDWKLQVGEAFPAHVVAEQVGVTVEELVTAIHDRDYSVLEPAAEFWNEAWLSPTPGTLPDPALTPVNGQYALKEGGWVAGQSLTLTANESYWGTPAATRELTYRFAAADTHVQALQNGDLDVIEPQATVDTLAQLEALGDRVTVLTGNSLTWEHLDFNFREGNVFADDLALREAFALCVPRQQIVDNLIKPINPDAVVLNAREVFPFQDRYEDVVGVSYDGRYDAVDLDAARERVQASGATEPVQVRIGYSAPNPRRADQVALIKSSCDQAGFEVTDVGSSDFFDTTLPNGDYEVALFAWASSGQIASGQNIYSSTGAQNYGQFSNAEVDAAWDVLASTVDTDVHLEQMTVIETLLWDQLFGIPVFTHPGVVAHASDLGNVRLTSTQSMVPWNAEQWVRGG